MDDQFIEVMKRSASNIEAFHKKQLRSSWIDTKPDGSILGQRILPLAVSGVYVPGGKAAAPKKLGQVDLTAEVEDNDGASE